MSPLRCYMSWLALDGIDSARFAHGRVAAIRDAGYEGIQFGLSDPTPIDRAALVEARALGLGVCGSGRVNSPAEAAALAQAAIDLGLECLTLHAGWGIESDDEAARLIEAILAASSTHRIPLYVETHRATIFQDMQRTVSFVERFPELRFNGDFSHWYTGLEMVYGGFEKKLAYIQPVIDRVRFLHGRIGTPGCMQVAIERNDPAHYVAHFRALWTACFVACLSDPGPPQPFITFAAELLAPQIYYARCFRGAEESDRWQQSLLLCEIARECFAEAKRGAEPSTLRERTS